MGDSASAATGSASPQAKPPLDYDYNSKVIGTTSETIKNGVYSDPIQKLVCESSAWFARENYGDLYDIDFLFYNIGIISGTLSSVASGVLQKGDITIANVKAVLPYGDDKLTIISLKGVDVIEMFKPHGSGPKAVGIASKEIVGNFFNGAPIDQERTYIIATSSYLVGGGDGYTVLKDNATVLLQTGIPSWRPLIDWIYDQEDPINQVIAEW
jgi:2',3'-cyclic-nucleotide 2'-phosphodiesterase (5'-nucleotidase family)